MPYTKLFYTAVDFTSLTDGITPHLYCPVCNYQFLSNKSFGASFPATFDFNGLVAFKIPSHTNVTTGLNCAASNVNISLFVAVHRDADGLRLCIQKSSEEGAGGIPAGWWMKPF